MRKPFKIILTLVFVPVLLLIIAACILSFFVDPKSFEPEIVAAVKKQTGRDLKINGELKLSVFPWLGIETGPMVLSNASGFKDQNFVTIEQSNINVKLLPLLDKKLEVSRIVLKGLSLNLIKNQQGLNNWDDLIHAKDNKAATAPQATKAPAPAPAQQAAPAESLAAFAIGGLSIEDAKINWQDLQAGHHIVFKDLNLHTGQFTFDQPVSVELSLLIDNTEAKVTENIDLKTSLSLSKKLEQLVLSDTRIKTTTTGPDLPNKSLDSLLSISHVSLDKVKQTGIFTDIKLQIADLTVLSSLTANNLTEQPTVQGPVSIENFSPVKFMNELAIKAPPMQDKTALNKMAVFFNIQATPDYADLKNLLITLDDTEIKGSTRIRNFADPALEFQLAINSVDLDRYLAPENERKAEKKPGTAKPISSPAATVATGASLFPVETLRKLNAEGTISLGELKVKTVEMQDIQLNLSAKEGVVSTKQTVKNLYQGAYFGDFNLDVRNKKPVLTIDEKLEHVQLEPLLTAIKGEAKITGTADLTAKLQGQGNTKKGLKSSLNGPVSFLIRDGAIKGINLNKIINKGEALVSGAVLKTDTQNDQTEFSEIKGTAILSNGLLQNNDLLAKTERLRVTGQGAVNLMAELLDYKITAQLIKTKATATEPEQYHQTPVGIKIGGTFSQPDYSLDVDALLTEKNKAKVNKLLDKLDKKIGGGLGDLLRKGLDL